MSRAAAADKAAPTGDVKGFFRKDQKREDELRSPLPPLK